MIESLLSISSLIDAAYLPSHSKVPKKSKQIITSIMGKSYQKVYKVKLFKTVEEQRPQ